MLLLAVRAIDLAIFGTLGSLWIGGAVFIYVLFRWIRRYEGKTSPFFAKGAPALSASATASATASAAAPAARSAAVGT